jgi:6,7-dimethyl-8-ribityllumazine synthase
MSAQITQTEILNLNNLQIPPSQVVLVYTEWNTEVINELRNGAKKIVELFPTITLREIKVPGAIEITFAIAELHRAKPADAYIALGCVIRGETPHFDYVCQSVTQGITHLNTIINTPVIFGILTVNQISEAYDRLGGKHGHKGEEAAIAALKMIAFKYSLS